MIRSNSHHARLYRFSQILCVMMVLWYVVVPAPVSGYHFFYIQDGTNQLVLKWRTLGVSFVVDQDPMSFQAEVQTAVDTWNNVSTAKNVFGSLSQSTTDFTGANFGTAWGMLNADGRQEVVFDMDGSALAAVGLDPLTINGYAPTREVVIGGQGTINDAYFIVNGSRTNFDRLSTLTHELGHVQGLAHSSVGMNNSNAFPSDALDVIDVNSVPTMHPFSVAGTARRTLEPDDIAALSELYPEPSFATSFGSIAGKVTRCSTDKPVTGANIRAINTSNSNIQLSRFTGFNGNDQGSFVINGLPPGSYRLVVEPMGANGFSIDRFRGAGAPPVTAEMDFPTEYHNPPQEDDCSEELPDSAVNVAVSAGGNATNKNFKVGAVDLAFVIDDTGSMGNEIGAVRTVLSQFVSIMNTITSALGIPFPNTTIVTFKDNVTKRLISNDPARLQAVISSLSASSGGDCPESSNAALLTAGRLLRNGGVAMLFTDADSRADGPDRNTVTQLYRSKSLKLSTLLSGTCTAFISSTTPWKGPLSGTTLARYSPSCAQGVSGISPNTEEFPLPPTLGVENGVRTFSEISIETGGFFTAITGIKFGDPTERQRYINTGTNIAVSSVVPAVGLLTPGDGPQGSTLDVEITGSNTNFQSSSAVTFSGAGITINSRTVNSPQSITVNISIQSGAVLGFRDVTVTTNLGGGSVETATGFGAFNVVSPPFGPTVIGVSPPRGAQGKTLNVSISGANTNFVNGISTASFGPGITVNSTTVLSSTSAVANITIDSAATIGFRDVTVTTGAQIATENKEGPFLVTAPPPSIPRITMVEPPEGRQGQTLNITITGENTHFANGTSAVSFSGTGITVNSTNITSATTAVANITIAAGAALGFRDVFVTTGGEVAVILQSFQVTEKTDDPKISVNDISVLEGQSGTTSATFTLRLSSPSAQDVTVRATTQGISATSGSDYQGISNVLLRIPAGSTSSTVSVSVNGDSTIEPDETFSLILSDPLHATIADGQGVCTIVNDDSSIQFSASAYSINEGTVNTPQGYGSLIVDVKRTGDTSKAATVQFLTSDDSGGNECNQVTTMASQRCDYSVAAGTLRFAAGESTKQIQIPIVNDGYIEGNETFKIKLQNPTGGASLGSTDEATITLEDRGALTTPAENPYLRNEFFVRMNYLDFLAREPDTAGFNGWTAVLNNCGPEKGFLGAPPDCDRAHVSHGFFGSPEFTDTGYLIYRLYEVGLNRLPRYSEFTPDMASLSGFGLTNDVKKQNLNNYLQQFTSRQEFINRFQDVSQPSQAAALILKLEQIAGVKLPSTATTQPGQPPQYSRQELIVKRQTGQLTLGQTLKAFCEQKVVYDRYFERGEVTMMYFAYLRRDPDLNDPNLNGWKEWVFVFTNGGAQRSRPDIQPRDIHHLIFGFIYSEEYRKRFGAP